MKDYEEMALNGAVEVHKVTGNPIITHTGGAAIMGIEQTLLSLSEGTNPERIAIGHIWGSSDIGYHLAILDEGVSIAVDRLGLTGYTLEKGSLAAFSSCGI